MLYLKFHIACWLVSSFANEWRITTKNFGDMPFSGVVKSLPAAVRVLCYFPFAPLNVIAFLFSFYQMWKIRKLEKRIKRKEQVGKILKGMIDAFEKQKEK